MDVRRKIFFTSTLHWVYFPLFFVFYGLSFKFTQLRDWFFLLAAAMITSWLPYKGCPLTAWENGLREKAGLQKRRMFGLTDIVDRKLRKSLGFGLPRGTTLFIVIAMVLIRIWVG